MRLANSCAFLIPLRHLLDMWQKHLLEPEKVASGMLEFRKQEAGSTHIAKLITKDKRENSRALTKELEAGIGHIQTVVAVRTLRSWTPRSAAQTDARHATLGPRICGHAWKGRRSEEVLAL